MVVRTAVLSLAFSIPVFAHDLALVFVDMQKPFLENRYMPRYARVAPLVEAQLALCRWAQTHDVPALVFEYAKSGPTVEPLNGCLRALPRHAFVQKRENNGFFSESEGRAQILRDWGARRLIVAGVNAGGCVRGTANAAVQLGFRVLTAGDLVEQLDRLARPDRVMADYLRSLGYEVFDDVASLLGCAATVAAVLK